MKREVAGLNGWEDTSASFASLSNCCSETGVRSMRLGSSGAWQNKLKKRCCPNSFLGGSVTPLSRYLVVTTKPSSCRWHSRVTLSPGVSACQLCGVSYTSSSHLSPGPGRGPWPLLHFHVGIPISGWAFCMKYKETVPLTLHCFTSCISSFSSPTNCMPPRVS